MEENKDFQTDSGFRGCKLFHGGRQWEFEFNNGYVASVITLILSHCNQFHPYEFSVLKHCELCYDTPITDYVIGYLTSNEVYDLLDRIEQLQGQLKAY